MNTFHQTEDACRADLLLLGPVSIKSTGFLHSAVCFHPWKDTRCLGHRRSDFSGALEEHT
eukprot:1970967-Amphidinium_carterae.1